MRAIVVTDSKGLLAVAVLADGCRLDDEIDDLEALAKQAGGDVGVYENEPLADAESVRRWVAERLRD